MKKKVIAVIAVLALVVLVRSCLLPVTVSGTSMESTLQDGEFAIMSRDFSVIKRFDIVVLRALRYWRKSFTLAPDPSGVTRLTIIEIFGGCCHGKCSR